MHIPLLAVFKRNITTIALLTAITLFAYIFSLNNKFVWDDEQFIYNNAYVKNFETIKIFTENTIAGAGETSTYYRPLTTLSFAVDHAIWKLNPIGFHLTNTLLHLGAGLLLFFYLRALKFSKLSSFTIASIFLVHPIQTEAVVYANSRGDSMYTFWAMVSILSFALLLTKKYPTIKIYDLEITANKIFLSSIVILSYLLAILGKEIGIATLGLLFLTYLFLQLQNKKMSTEKILKNIFGITTLISSSVIAFAYIIFRNTIINIPTTQGEIFAGTAYGDSVFVRLHTFTQAIWNYFALLFFPYPLHMERNLEVLEKPISVWLIATIILFVALTITAIKEYKKQKTFYIAFGSLWFFCMLAPVSGIIPVNGLIYEHWLYVPLIGFAIALYGLKNTLIPQKQQTKINAFLQGMLPLALLVFIALTIRQNYIWGDPIRFYSYTLKFSDSARLHNNLAMSYADVQDYENAIIEYNKAIESSDFYPQTHHNLANTYLAVGETELAKKEFSTAIRMNPQFYPSYIPLIKIFMSEESYENVDKLVNTLIEVTPNNIEFKYIKAQSQLKQGHVVEGLKTLGDILQTPGLGTQLKILIQNEIKNYK